MKEFGIPLMDVRAPPTVLYQPKSLPAISAVDAVANSRDTLKLEASRKNVKGVALVVLEGRVPRYSEPAPRKLVVNPGAPPEPVRKYPALLLAPSRDTLFQYGVPALGTAVPVVAAKPDVELKAPPAPATIVSAQTALVANAAVVTNRSVFIVPPDLFFKILFSARTFCMARTLK